MTLLPEAQPLPDGRYWKRAFLTVELDEVGAPTITAVAGIGIFHPLPLDVWDEVCQDAAPHGPDEHRACACGFSAHTSLAACMSWGNPRAPLVGVDLERVIRCRPGSSYVLGLHQRVRTFRPPGLCWCLEPATEMCATEFELVGDRLLLVPRCAAHVEDDPVVDQELLVAELARHDIEWQLDTPGYLAWMRTRLQLPDRPVPRRCWCARLSSISRDHGEDFYLTWFFRKNVRDEDDSLISTCVVCDTQWCSPGMSHRWVKRDVTERS